MKKAVAALAVLCLASASAVGLTLVTTDGLELRLIESSYARMTIEGIDARSSDVEIYSAQGGLLSRQRINVSGCTPNKLGPKLGRMLIVSGNPNPKYWTRGGDTNLDTIAQAVCSETNSIKSSR